MEGNERKRMISLMACATCMLAIIVANPLVWLYAGQGSVPISGNVTWSVPEETSLPSEIIVQLKDGDLLMEEVVITKEDNWEYTFDKVPKYDANHREIIYEVKTSEIKGFTITAESTNLLSAYTSSPQEGDGDVELTDGEENQLESNQGEITVDSSQEGEDKPNTSEDDKVGDKPSLTEDSKEDSPSSPEDSKGEEKPASSEDSKEADKPDSTDDNKSQNKPSPVADNKEDKTNSSEDNTGKDKPNSPEDNKGKDKPEASEDNKSEEKPEASEDNKSEEKPEASEDNKSEEKPEASEDNKSEEKPSIVEDNNDKEKSKPSEDSKDKNQSGSSTDNKNEEKPNNSDEKTAGEGDGEAEEKSGKEEQIATPKTDDTFDEGFWTNVLIVSLVGLLLTCLFIQRENEMKGMMVYRYENRHNHKKGNTT